MRLRDRPRLVVAAVLIVLVPVLVLTVALWPAAPGVEASTYGYSLSLETNATLEDVTVEVPLPVTASGQSPIASAVRAGNATVPDGWNATVVETGRGPHLRLDAAVVPGGRADTGRRAETYLVSARAAADERIETGDPLATEPILQATTDHRERPCPNVVDPPAEMVCYSFDTAVFAAYEAPRDASVTLYVVASGVTTDGTSRHAMYNERVPVFLVGPQDGWVEAEGFLSTEPGP